MQRTPKQDARRRSLTIALRFILLLVFVCAGLVAINLAGRNGIEKEINTQLDALRAAHQPTTAADLAKLYPDPPPEHDAIRLLQPALDTLSEPDDGSTNLPFFGGMTPMFGRLSDESMKKATALLETNETVLAQIPWSALDKAWVGRGFQNGFPLLSNPPFHKINIVVKLLCLNAIIQADHKKSHEAMISLEHVLTISKTLSNSVPLEGLVKNGYNVRVCDALEHVLNRSDVPDEDLKSISSLFTASNIDFAKSILTYQRCYDIWVATFVKTNTEPLVVDVVPQKPPPFNKLLSKIEHRGVYRDEDFIHFLNWNRECLLLMDRPLSNAIPALLEMEAQNEKDRMEHRNTFLNILLNRNRSMMAGQMTEFDFSRVLISATKSVAKVETAKTAIALKRWQQTHGGLYPESLAALVPAFIPEIPNDPFTSQPLHYKKTPKGCIVYSVGPDFTDDAGKLEPIDGNSTNHYDIVFTLERE